MKAKIKHYDNCLKFVIKCEVFSLDESFQGACFGHVFSKACQ